MRSSDRDSICGRDDRPFSIGLREQGHKPTGEPYRTTGMRHKPTGKHYKTTGTGYKPTGEPYRATGMVISLRGKVFP